MSLADTIKEIRSKRESEFPPLSSFSPIQPNQPIELTKPFDLAGTIKQIRTERTENIIDVMIMET